MKPNAAETTRRVGTDDKEREFSAAVLDGLQLFDDLIQAFYEEIKSNVPKYCKTGDFIKMVDLRHKLSPTRAEEQEFWNKIAQIRRDAHKLEEKRGQEKKSRHNAVSKKEAAE